MVSATALAVRGSSPRMRGTQSRCRPCMRRTGIIPAYAGNTRGGSNATADIRDHPRVCGEHTSRNSSRRRMTGSSPRMRGTRHRRSVRSLRAGIIPAYAGNTGWYVSRYAARRDHPRVCGEHEPLLLPKLRTLGSSPRMRGTPVAKGPAMVMPRDHPRVCGEHILSFVKSFSWLGSSPRMRGTLGRGGARRVFRGIIPAYAGNTLDALSVASMVAGSSPRMRGTQVE